MEIAGEPGYEGTSITAVSAKCGLPASSIQWHFKDKDDLIAAVIERSFENWAAAQRDLLMANLFAQGQAPAFGKTRTDPDRLRHHRGRRTVLAPGDQR